MSIIMKLYVTEDNINKKYISPHFSTTNGFEILAEEFIHQLYYSQRNLSLANASR